MLTLTERRFAILLHMKKIILVLLLALLIGAALLIYSILHPKEDENVLTLFGNVDIRQVDLGFRVPGRVVQLFFQEGDFVPQGALMATLEEEPYLDQVKQAEATLGSTKFSLENAEKILKRRKDLISDGSVSKEDLEDATTSRDVALANFNQAEAALGVAEKNLFDTEVFSPIDGTILTRIREPGTVASAGDPVYTLSILSPLWIRAYVTEPNLGRIYPGMEAEVTNDTKNSPVFKGRIGFISPVAEFTPKTVETTSLRTDLVYRLRIYIDDPGWSLRQGMPVTVRLRTDRPFQESKSD